MNTKIRVDMDIIRAVNFVLEDISRAPNLNFDYARMCSQRKFSRALGEALWWLIKDDIGHFRDFPKEERERLVASLIKSGYLRGIYFFAGLSQDFTECSEDFITKCQERIIFGKEPGCASFAYRLLCNVKMPEELVQEGIRRNHSSTYWFKRKKSSARPVTDALDSILSKKWLVRKNPQVGAQVFFRTRTRIPVFADSDWGLVEMTSEGALIKLVRPGYVEDSLIAREIVTKVVLLPDVSTPAKQGYAIEMPPETASVHEAIAWMYGRDPKEWKRFDKEV